LQKRTRILLTDPGEEAQESSKIQAGVDSSKLKNMLAGLKKAE